jgi:hypothetical protein
MVVMVRVERQDQLEGRGAHEARDVALFGPAGQPGHQPGDRSLTTAQLEDHRDSETYNANVWAVTSVARRDLGRQAYTSEQLNDASVWSRSTRCFRRGDPVQGR